MPAPIKVELLQYSPSWAMTAQAEAQRLEEALGATILAAHHIGSTAIPGIQAKPIIDLMPVVRSVTELDDQEAELVALGYQCWGEYGIPGRRYCTLDDPATAKRQFQLHCYEPDNDHIERHLAFRDFLRTNPLKAKEYDAEKQRSQELHPDDSHAYTDEKSDWIAAQLPAALAYFRSTQ